MSQITIELDAEQSRKITAAHIGKTMCDQKQYLNSAAVVMYKNMLREFATLIEYEAIKGQYDRCWPTDVKWEQQ